MKNITIPSGVDAIRYDFYEVLPASLSGFVYADDNNNGIFDNSESGIGGVTLTLLDASGNSTGLTTVTDSTGFYSFTESAAGHVRRCRNAAGGYLDGLDTAGTVGGTAHNPGDLIDAHRVGRRREGEELQFRRNPPGEPHGPVFVDFNGNDTYDSGETLLSGVTMYLTDVARQSRRHGDTDQRRLLLLPESQARHVLGRRNSTGGLSRRERSRRLGRRRRSTVPTTSSISASARTSTA